MRNDGRSIPDQALEAMRVRAIAAHQGGQSVSGIAQTLGLHCGSVSRWLTKWRRHGEKALRRRIASGRPRTLDCARYGPAIIRIVKKPADRFGYENPLWNCRRITETLRRQLRLRVSVPTVWRALKSLKLSSQKPERRAIEQDPVARAKWLQEEWPVIKEQARKERALIFFEDESGIRLTPTVGRTWAPVGKTPIIRVTGKRACICVMSAVSPDGRLFFAIPKDKVNSDVFIAFLHGLLKEHPGRRIFVIADQASAHVSRRVREFAGSVRRLKLFFLPPYSPDFNPDEKAWCHLEHHEMKAHNARDKKGLRRRTSRALHRMQKQPSLVRSFFRRSGIT